MSTIPSKLKVVIANIGELGVEQSYENIQIVQNDDINTHPPLFFNTIYDKYQSDIYLFLTQDFTLQNTNAITEIVNVFVEYQQVVGVYSDIIINKDGYSHMAYTPAYDRQIIVSNNIINNPLAFTNKCRPSFDVNIKHLSYYQVLKALGHRFLFCHIPLPLFVCNHPKHITQQHITNDMNIIKQY